MCGLPFEMGHEILHDSLFGGNCKSIGRNKIIPARWWIWRNKRDIIPDSLCNKDMKDIEFTVWLGKYSLYSRTNLIDFYMWYTNLL